MGQCVPATLGDRPRWGTGHTGGQVTPGGGSRWETGLAGETRRVVAVTSACSPGLHAFPVDMRLWRSVQRSWQGTQRRRHRGPEAPAAGKAELLVMSVGRPGFVTRTASPTLSWSSPEKDCGLENGRPRPAPHVWPGSGAEGAVDAPGATGVCVPRRCHQVSNGQAQASGTAHASRHPQTALQTEEHNSPVGSQSGAGGEFSRGQCGRQAPDPPQA